MTILSESEKKRMRDRYTLKKDKQANELILETVQIVGVSSDHNKAKKDKEQEKYLQQKEYLNNISRYIQPTLSVYLPLIIPKPMKSTTSNRSIIIDVHEKYATDDNVRGVM